MRFSIIDKRDPLTSILKIVALVIVLFVGFGLVKGIHRYRAGYIAHQEKQLPFGVSAAAYTTNSLQLSGWSPAGTEFQIFDQNKLNIKVASDNRGKWQAVIPLEKRTKNFQAYTLAYGVQDKSYDTGLIAVFTPEKYPDEAYVWWKNNAGVKLLMTPDASDVGELLLASIEVTGDRGITLLGTGIPESLIHVYAGNEFVGAGTVSATDFWSSKPSVKSDDKVSALRFDELRGAEVIERRSYKIDLLDAKDVPSAPMDLLHTTKDAWVLGGKMGDYEKSYMIVLKPEAGESGGADELIAGQIIPIVPAQSGKMLVP